MIKNIFIMIIVSITFMYAKSDTLRVAMSLTYPPFEMTDTSGNPTGFSVDFANKLAKSLGYKKAEIINIGWTGLIPSLITNRADVIISSMSPTKERAKKVDFSVPYAKFRLAMIVGIGSKIYGKKDLVKGKVMAVKLGTIADVYATKYLEPKGIKVIRLTEDTGIVEILQGKADFVMNGYLNILKYYNKYPYKTRMIFDPLITTTVAVVVKKGNKKLLKRINKFIVDYKKKRGFEELARKYLSREMKALKMLNVPFMFD